ncbi:MAG: sugar phosphate isomerase/epimerase [Planctomycetota bacterium]|nr:sugar phosphate isomerase/epimerase [Planctomycetota bacterium]
MPAAPRLSTFPKCWLDQIVSREKDLFEWIEESATLGAEGCEMYDRFMASDEPAYLAKVRRAIEKTGQVVSLMCFSPDFTQPDPEARKREIEKQKRAIDLTADLGGTFCRTLSGQRRPEVTRAQGVEWVVECIAECLPYAEKRGVTLCMENHYKDGYWHFPEFAQLMDVFCEIVGRIDHPSFGVQFDPSNSVVAGEDPLALLDRVKTRVVSMHASDRYLEKGATFEDLQRDLGKQGYSPLLKHGVTGQGLNDYDGIFRRLKEVNFAGWISIEDGMNGLDEMRESVEFLKRKRKEFFGV